MDTKFENAIKNSPPGLMKNGQKFHCMRTRENNTRSITRENNKNKVNSMGHPVPLI